MSVFSLNFYCIILYCKQVPLSNTEQWEWGNRKANTRFIASLAVLVTYQF